MEDTLGSFWAYFVDKVVIALLLLLAGWIATLVIEKFKVGLAYKAELAKMRVEALAQTWEAASESEANADVLIEAASKVIGKGGANKNLTALIPLENASKASSEKFKCVAVKNRFFLGDKHYGEFIKFNNAIMELLDAVASGDPKRVKQAKAKILAHRGTLDNFAKIPF